MKSRSDCLRLLWKTRAVVQEREATRTCELFTNRVTSDFDKVMSQMLLFSFSVSVLSLFLLLLPVVQFQETAVCRKRTKIMKNAHLISVRTPT